MDVYYIHTTQSLVDAEEWILQYLTCTPSNRTKAIHGVRNAKVINNMVHDRSLCSEPSHLTGEKILNMVWIRTK